MAAAGEPAAIAAVAGRRRVKNLRRFKPMMKSLPGDFDVKRIQDVFIVALMTQIQPSSIPMEKAGWLLVILVELDR